MPQPRYPKQFKHLGDHLRARRIDLGLFQKEAAVRIGVDTANVTNWELGNTEPEERLIPALIRFLGYNPLAQPLSLGQAVRSDRGAETRVAMGDRGILVPLEGLRADPRREMHVRGG